MRMGKIIAIMALLGFIMPIATIAMADVEPNDDATNAEVIEEGKIYSGHMSSSDEVDWYKISLNADEGFKISYQGEAQIFLYDMSLAYVDSNYWNTDENFILYPSQHESGFAYLKFTDPYYESINYTFSVDIKHVPSAPRNLEVVKVTTTEIMIQWDPPSDDGGVGLEGSSDGGIGYKIYRGGTEIETIRVERWEKAETTYVNYINNHVDGNGETYPSPEHGVNYTWSVTAFSWVGESEPSNIVHAGLKEESASESSDTDGLITNVACISAIIVGGALLIFYEYNYNKKRKKQQNKNTYGAFTQEQPNYSQPPAQTPNNQNPPPQYGQYPPQQPPNQSPRNPPPQNP